MNYLYPMQTPILFFSAVVENFFRWVTHADALLFVKINQGWTSPFGDRIFPVLREPGTWIPMYVFLFFFAMLNMGKTWWAWVIFFIGTVGLTDQCSLFIKNSVHRIRPCNNSLRFPQLRLLLDHCPGAFSFTSSHAANHFGMAVFVMLSTGRLLGKWRYLFLAWAVCISYAQVYVGAHYPTDVFAGGLTGALLGGGTAWLYRRIFAGMHN